MALSSARKSNSDSETALVSRARGWVDRTLGRGTRGNAQGVAPRPASLRELVTSAGLTALDFVAAVRAERAREYATTHPAVSCAITIQRSPDEVYAFYRKFSQLPLIMDFLHLVREADNQWSHWVARLPSGTVAWDVKVIEDRPGQSLAWRSVKEAASQVRTRLTFVPVGTGATEVRAEVQLGFGTSEPGAELTKCFSEPQLRDDLRRLKRMMEQGYVTGTDADLQDEPTAEATAPSPAPVERLPSKEVWRFERQPTRLHAH
jgi:uncharacterized membrane protein